MKELEPRVHAITEVKFAVRECVANLERAVMWIDTYPDKAQIPCPTETENS